MGCWFVFFFKKTDQISYLVRAVSPYKKQAHSSTQEEGNIVGQIKYLKQNFL